MESVLKALGETQKQRLRFIEGRPMAPNHFARADMLDQSCISRLRNGLKVRNILRSRWDLSQICSLNQFRKPYLRGKPAISNSERGVVVAKTNDRDKKGEKSTATVYFAVRTSTDEYQGFSLRKIMGPTQIYGCMKGQLRSTVENMSRSKNACSV